MTEQEKYRTFTFKSVDTGEVFSYKETHEGLMCQMEDGTWTHSWVFDDLDALARMVQTDKVEQWEVTWS